MSCFEAVFLSSGQGLPFAWLSLMAPSCICWCLIPSRNTCVEFTVFSIGITMFSYFSTPCLSKAKGTIMIRNRAIWILTTISLWPALAVSAEEEITYSNQVSRIIQDNCQICHQPGGIGPMSFTNYDEVRPWAPLIRLKVADREMPPYQ